MLKETLLDGFFILREGNLADDVHLIAERIACSFSANQAFVAG